MRLVDAQGRRLWLAYCMNVHAGGLADQRRALDDVVAPLRERLGARGPFGVGLRFHEDGLAALRDDPRRRAAFARALRAHDLVPFTANGFVVGPFHGRPLKDAVYAPSWRDARRAAYTRDLAAVLADLARETGDLDCVSLSTSPLAWRGWGDEARERDEGARALVGIAEDLARLEAETGVRVVLGLEPEPGCVLDRTADAAGFLAHAVREAGGDAARAHIGVCYDVCHQAVMDEGVEEGLDHLARHGVPLAKAQLTCALEAPDPADPEQRRALAAFDEPVYLHQVGGRDAAGAFRLAPDLGAALGGEAGLGLEAPWRVHFHVPVFRRELVGGLRTTRAHLEALLGAVARRGATPHLEIETYTFDVIPEAERRAGSGHDLVRALESEFRAVLADLASHGVAPEEGTA